MWYSADDDKYNKELGIKISAVGSVDPFINKITFDKNTKYGDFKEIEITQRNSSVRVPIMYKVFKNKVEAELTLPLIDVSAFNINIIYVDSKANAKNKFTITLPHAL